MKLHATVFFIFFSLIPASASFSGLSHAQNDTFPEHPFLFFSGDDIPHLRNEIQTTHKKYFDRLKTFCDKIYDVDPIAPSLLSDSHDIRQVYYENSMQIILNMSLLYVLTDDDKYKEKAVTWLNTFCDYPMNKIGHDGGYHIGTYAAALGIGYDFLYQDLYDTLKKKIQNRLVETEKLGREEGDHAWWSSIDIHHDHWLPIAGLGIGAAALYGEVTESKEWIDYFKNKVEGSMKYIGNDGSWTEGAACWVYAMSLVYPFFDIYKRLFGEDLFKSPFFENAIPYRIYNYFLNGTYINHHDSFPNGRYNILGSASCHLMRRLAAEFQDGHAQWMADREEEYDLKDVSLVNNWIVRRGYEPPILHSIGWSFLWYDPAVTSVTPDDLPLYHYFENQGLMILKSGWSDKDVTFTFTSAPIGGHIVYQAAENGHDFTENGEMYHIHALVNSFNLYVNGNYLATPPGEGYQENGSELHNTLTIEGATQIRSPYSYAEMRKMDLQKDYIYMAGDATSVYPANINLQRWYRHIAYLPPDVFVIGDELMVKKTMNNNAVTKWQMDFNNHINKVSISDSEIRVASSDADKGALKADIFIDAENKKTEQQILHGGWFDYGQVTVSMENFFSEKTKQKILAVLTALESTEAVPPAVREVKADNIMGAVVDRTNRKSVSALFVIFQKDEKDNLPLHFNILSKDTLVCHIFSLAPEKSYDITATSSPDGEFRNYSISITKGIQYTTNAQGSVTVEFLGGETAINNTMTRGMVVYPNPTLDHLTIGNIPPNKEYYVSIYNAHMQLIKAIDNRGNTNIHIDVNELPSGIYFCRISCTGETFPVKKFVVLK